jgi:hypothetical protein
MPVCIRPAKTEEDRQRIFRFRYEIYVEEMGRVQAYADHAARTVMEPFDDTGHLLMAEDETGEVVGTLRNNLGLNTDFGYYRELYGMDCVGRWYPKYVSISTKFMVASNLRKGSVAHRLAVEGYRHAVSHGMLFDFIDCNPHLEGTFERLGYIRYRSRIQHPEYGDVLPMVAPLTDLQHLEDVRSPWARICQEYYPHLEANRFLHHALRTH